MLDKVLIKEIVAPFLIVTFSMILYFFVSKITKRLFKKVNSKKSATIIGLINNIIKYFIIVIALLMILDVFGIDTKSLVASLGVLGLVVGLSLQDILKDFVSGASIVFENQYNVGDTVTINGFKGDVIALGMKTTKIKAYNGDVKVIGNGKINEVINHSVENSLAIVDIGIGYEEDIKKVEKILIELCQKMTKEITDIKGEVKMLGINELSDSAVVFRIISETKSGKHFDVQRMIRKEIKIELDNKKINIAYPQLVIHNG